MKILADVELIHKDMHVIVRNKFSYSNIYYNYFVKVQHMTKTTFSVIQFYAVIILLMIMMRNYFS